jgi:hypothetical protein
MQPMDTSPEMWKVYVDLYRKMPIAEKVRKTFEWSASIRNLSEVGMRRRYPDADDREIFLRMARMTFGGELFRKVYGDALPDDTRRRTEGHR